ncbi:MAG: DUF4026 domain-containing protein [Planctomycetota bacterium]|nr:DUF4026 domain-containing protein [Planctomycetota bacterium]
MESAENDSHSSILYAFWPDAELPLFEEARCRLEGWATQSGEGHENGAFWSQYFTIPEHPVPIHVWAGPRGEDLLFPSFKEVRWAVEEERQKAENAQWLLGIETHLNPIDPLQSYHLQLGFCMALCPNSPAIYDACSHTLRSGSEIERLTSSSVPPRTNELFSIHVVVGSDNDGAKNCWLHSHGLNRARAPEIDLLEVPETLCNAGYHLINGVAELLIGSDLPDAGEAFPVGHDLKISWKPWQDVLKARDSSLGGLGDRRGIANDHGGYRYVLLDAPENKESTPEGDPSEEGESAEKNATNEKPPSWQSPLATLEELGESSGVLFISRRETERMARLAKERWAIFGMLFARHKDDEVEDWRFLAKLGYQVEDGDSSEREHLWFEIKEIAPGRLKGLLLNEPVYISRIKEGDEGWHDLELLTDWNIVSNLGAFNPETADYLWDAARPGEELPS